MTLLSLVRDRQCKLSVCVRVCECTICMVACVWVCRKLMWQAAAYLVTKVKACSTLRYCLCASVVVWGPIVPWPHLPAGGCWALLDFIILISAVWHMQTLCLSLHWPPTASSGMPNASGKKKREKEKQGMSWPHVTSCLCNNYLPPLNSHWLIKVFLFYKSLY